VIRNAVSTGTMWRGLEVILKGRDPRDAWAFTERICGVCTGTHALTSVRAVEDALAIKIPENAQQHPQHHAVERFMFMITWCISITCMRSTGWMWFRH
jgi:Ni,Fe-hydrogenase I large subunit